jgi:hypothetical protein
MGVGEGSEAYLSALERRPAIGLFVRPGSFELPHDAQDQSPFPIRQAGALPRYGPYRAVP